MSCLGIKCHERHLKLAIALQSLRDQERAYSGLSQSHKSLGLNQEALVYSEKRLVVAHELGNEAKAAAFGDLGTDFTDTNSYIIQSNEHIDNVNIILLSIRQYS